MPEMRAESVREARRKGLERIEKPTDPYDLTSMSMPPDVHRSKRGELEPTPDATGSEPQPDPATREEHLGRDARLKGGATGGPT